MSVLPCKDVAIWRTGAFAGEFGDAFIKDTNLEGGSCTQALLLLLPIIEDATKEAGVLTDDLNLLSEVDVSKLSKIVNDFRFTIEVNTMIEKASRGSDMDFFPALLKLVTSRIEDLAVGDRLVLPGGWSTPSGGHAIMYIVERESSSHFAFCVCNTGNGIAYHPSTEVDYPKTKTITAMRFGGIPLSRIASSEFWYMTFHIIITRSLNHKPEVVYEVLLPFLANGSFHHLVEKEMDKCGHWESPQLAGTCYYRCILTALRYMMKRDGFTKLQQKQLFVKIRSGFLVVVEKHLDDSALVEEINSSDTFIIELACSQTGNAAAKLFSKSNLSRLNPHSLVKLDLQFQRIRERLSIIQHAFIAASEAVTSVACVTSHAALKSFDGFDLVMDDSDRSQKRGSTAVGSSSLYLNLIIPLARPKSVQELCIITDWAVERCDQIRTKSNLAAASVGLNQICSFVEYLFLVFVDMPSPVPSAENRESETVSSCLEPPEGIWGNTKGLTKIQQRNALSDVYRLAVHYVAATNSLGASDRAQTAVRSITTAGIFVVFDALLRIVLDDPLELSALLAESGFGTVVVCALNGNQPLSKLTDRFLLTRPETCITRLSIIKYLESITRIGSKLLFDYKFETGDGLAIKLTDQSVTLSFVKDLQMATGTLTAEIPSTNARRGRTIQSRVSQMNDMESQYAWYCSSWSDVCPEFARYRDINLLMRLMLQPQQIFASGRPTQEIWMTSDAQPEYDFISTAHDKKSVLFTVILAGSNISPSCKFVPNSPLYEQLEALTNSTEDLTEEALLFNESLPDFDHTLSSQEAEQFFTLLLHPFIAAPLILNFFSGDRIALLVNTKIQCLVEAVLHEPRNISFTDASEAAADCKMVPAVTRSQLRSNYGILYDEMKYAPDGLLLPLNALVENAITISISGFKSSVAGLLLFLVRICVRVETMCLFSWKTTHPADPLPSELFQLHSLLTSKVSRRIQEWANAALLEREVEVAVKMYCHLALIFGTSLDMALTDQGCDWVSNPEFIASITKYLCACTYVTCWHGNNGQEQPAEATRVSLYRPRRAQRSGGGAASAAPTEESPVSAVFYNVQRLRPAICSWMSVAPSSQLNSVLDSMASVGLQHPFKESSGWNRVSNAPLMCSLTVGNDVHPYLPCTDWSQTVSFPGASCINIFFDPRSATEKTNDYVTISYPGCLLKFDGPAGSLWPGSNGSPALSIPYDTFVVEFHSDRSGGDWGFAFTAVAPICIPASQRLVERAGCSMLVAQLALRECRNYEELAYQYIVEHLDELKQQETLELNKQSDSDKGDNVSPGLFQDCYGYVQINLQTCEVYVNNRMNMPIPSEIVAHPDYSLHFGKYKNILCTISSKDTNRLSIQIIDPDGKFGAYEIQAWTPLKPYGRKGSGLGAILNEDADMLADDGRCTAFNMPLPTKENFEFFGQRYVRYPKGQCGWLSAMFDRLSFLTDDDLMGVWCSENCLDMPSTAVPAEDEKCSTGRMYVQMQCSPGGRDLSDIEGHPGAWFEVVAVSAERLLLVFALIDVGRKMQRSLVYSSDINLAFKTLEPSSEVVEQPRHHLLTHEGGNVLGGFKDANNRVIPRPGVGTKQHATVGSLVVRRSRLEISKLVEGVSDSALGVFCSTHGLISLSQEEQILEEYINPSSLYGLLPEYFIEEFQFWRTGTRLIRGYKYSTKINSAALFADESLIVVVNKQNSCATIHKLMNGKREFTLLNPMVHSAASINSTLRALLTIFTKVEVLSHILFWTKSNLNFDEQSSNNSISLAEVSKIEFPRLQTSFDIRIRGDNEVSFALSDHDDLYLCFEVPDSVKALYAGFANCIPVKNSTNQYFLLVPSFGLIQPTVKVCPFMTSIVYDRSAKWAEKMQSRYFLYPVHASAQYLEMPSTSAALYWTLLCFVYRKYSMVSTLVNTVCQSDLKLNGEQRYILSQIPKTASESSRNVDSHPDAHACRLMLALMCVECGETIETNEWKATFWDVSEDLKGYVSKYAHVSQVCRLSISEERSLLSRFQDPVRSKYLDALERAVLTGEPVSIPTSGRKVSFGEDPIVKLGANIKRDLENWRSNLLGRGTTSTQPRRWFNFGNTRGELFYRRPAPQDLKSPSSIITLSTLWKCFEHQRSVSGSLSYLGFAFLYELLSGQVILQLTDKESVLDNSSVAPPFMPPPTPTPAPKKPPAFVERYSNEARQIQEMGMCADWTLEEVTALIDEYDGQVEPAIINCMEDEDGARLTAKKKLVVTTLEEGKRVECNFHNYGQWYPAVITRVCGEDTFDVAFDDGDSESGVPKSRIRLLDDGMENAEVTAMLQATGVVSELSPEELQAFVNQNRGKPLDDVVFNFLNDPQGAISELKKSVAEEAKKAELLRQEMTAPRRFPQNWLLVKLIAHTMFVMDTGGNTKHLAVLLLCSHFIENAVAGVMPTLPLFPFLANAKELDSQQGLQGDGCKHFYVSVIDKCLSQLEKVLAIRAATEKPLCYPSTIVVKRDDYHIRASITNTRCGRRPVHLLELGSLSSVTADERKAMKVFEISERELKAFESSPLSGLNSFTLIQYKPSTDGVVVSDCLPFDISQHPAAENNPVADGMINRIKEDMQQSARALSALQCPHLSCLMGITESSLATGSAHAQLTEVLNELLACMNEDNDKVITGIKLIEKLLNVLDAADDSVERRKFRFLLSSGLRCRITFEMFAASLASDTQFEDLRSSNPFLSKELCETLNSAAIIIMMRFVRSRQLASCIGKVRSILRALTKAASGSQGFHMTKHMLQHQSNELAQEMVKVRHCVFTDAATGSNFVDPRYLLFEFISGFLLRQRQVELIQDFMKSHAAGQSTVHQMIMGAGKTQIIAPILSLMLADAVQLVTLVCPGPLLPQSRAQLRSRFSNVLPKRILTLNFERSSPESNDLDSLQRLLFKLEVARSSGSLVLTTPQSVKSLFLKYLDLLQMVRNAPEQFRLPPSQLPGNLRAKMEARQKQFAESLKMADVLRRILSLWAGGVALLDEVDLLLHPLKSELNFPIGATEPLPLMPHRFELPLYLLDPFFSRKSKKFSKIDSEIWDEIQGLIDEGKHCFMFQSVPHLVLLNESYFLRKLRYAVTKWAIRWLAAQKEIHDDVSSILGTVGYTLTAESVHAYLEQYIYCEQGHPHATIACAFVSHHFSSLCVQLLNLCRHWVWVYLPHVLSKIHRVSFGLIGDDDIQRWREQEIEAAGGDSTAADNVVISRSRRLLAVPFVGKDVPSRASEFANPEVQIGLTILAYKLHGLRVKNIRELVTDLKRSFLMEPGPFSDRPSRILFEEWKSEAALDAALSTSHSLSVAEGEPETHQVAASEILPLEILQTADEAQMKLVTEVLKLERAVVTHYLTRFVFPSVLKFKPTKLQANGIDLGGEMMFGTRFGFSGTPSELLPLELRPCHYEPGSEAEIIRTLSNPDILSVPDSLQVGANWDVEALLARVAQGGYSSLIDCGALITGFTPEQVARRLLSYQHPHKPDRKEVCVFLDERDLKMVVDINGGPAYELERCGVELDKRMVFYDHVHTTGIDIKHSIDAIAVCTLGKDLTLRDYSQGCWRMRGLGQGQRVHVLIIEEINKLIEGIQVTDNKLADILAWLTINSISSERLQYMQLEGQIAANAKRQAAFRTLTQSKLTAPSKTEVFLPSIFFSKCTDAEVEQIVCKSVSASFLAGPERDKPRSNHPGVWRKKVTMFAERAWCDLRYLSGEEEQTCASCTHHMESYQVVTGDHWTCCGDRNRNSTECAVYDPTEVVDFVSPRVASVPLVAEFYDGLCALLSQYSNGNVNREAFVQVLAGLAPLETQDPAIWSMLNGSLYPPYVDINISTLLQETNMHEYASNIFNDAAVRVIEKLTIQTTKRVEVTEAPLTSSNDVDEESAREEVRNAIDVFMEPITVDVVPSVFYQSGEVIGKGEFVVSESDIAAMLAGPHADDMPAADLHNNDREIVQEQEKERDEEREMEIFKVVHPQADKDPAADCRWNVQKLSQGIELADMQGKFSFYPLNQFNLGPSQGDTRLPFPPSLFVSEGYAPFVHASQGNRRLKNVTVLMQWKPVTDVNTEVPEHLKLITVLLSLAEAETLRFVVSRTPGLSQSVTLWAVDPQPKGTALSPPLFAKAAAVPIGRRTPMIRNESIDPKRVNDQKLLEDAVQFARYFNNCMYFEDDALLAILSELQSIPASTRKHLFECTMRGRLRDQILTDRTPVAHVFEQSSADHLRRVLSMMDSIKAVLLKEFESTDEAFAHFAERNLEFSPSDLHAGLKRLNVALNIDEEDATAIVAYIASMAPKAADRAIHFGPTITRTSFCRLRPSKEADDALSTSLFEALQGLNVNEEDGAHANIFQGHSQEPGRGNKGSDTNLKPVNEFFSHLHTPNIQSIGQIVVIPTPASLASGQSSRVNISNDCCLSTDSVHILTVAPRGVKLDARDGGVWCFEITVLSSGNWMVGFTDAASNDAQARLRTPVSPMECGVAGAKVVDFSHAAKGDVIRFCIDMSNGVTISYQHYHYDESVHGSGARTVEPIVAFTTLDMGLCRALFPLVSFDRTFKFRLNMGSLPFSSQLGNMRSGGHSLFHWIRTQQERQYVRNRHALGGYGNLSNVSGRFHLEIVRQEKEYQWEMRMASKENQKGSTMWEAAFPTVFVDGVVLTQGKWYYEVTIRTNNVASQFGWADMDFVASNDNGQGVGDEKHSWAYDGDRKCLWHARSIAYGDYWKVGDVLGCACDLDVGCKTIQFSLNGKWYQPAAFTGIQYSVGLMPALTTQARLSSISYYVNFSREWKFAPPSDNYTPICEWIEYGKQFLRDDKVPTPALDVPPPSSNTSMMALGNPDLVPSAPGRMFRQHSAQPQHIPDADLWYVPLVVKCGLDQVSVTHPLPELPNSPTSVRGCGEDDNTYPSLVADRVSLRKGRWCYEATLRSAPASAKCSLGFAEVAWVDGHWSEMNGVGDDAMSWGLFYKSGVAVYSRWNKATTPQELRPHAKLDRTSVTTISMAVDFDTRCMYLSLNGGEPITVFENFQSSAALVPAFSLQGSPAGRSRGEGMTEQIEFDVNFGNKPFTHDVFTDMGFQSVHSSLFAGRA